MTNNKRRSGLYNDRRAYRQYYGYEPTEPTEPTCPPISLNTIATLTNGIYVLNNTTTILECQTLTIPMITQLSIPNGRTLTNNGTIVIGNTSLITIGGVLINSGTITNTAGGGQINNNGMIDNLLSGVIDMTNSGNGGFIGIGVVDNNNGVINNSSSILRNDGNIYINYLKNTGTTNVINNNSINVSINVTNIESSSINNNQSFNVITDFLGPFPTFINSYHFINDGILTLKNSYSSGNNGEITNNGTVFLYNHQTSQILNTTISSSVYCYANSTLTEYYSTIYGLIIIDYNSTLNIVITSDDIFIPANIKNSGKISMYGSPSSNNIYVLSLINDGGTIDIQDNVIVYNIGTIYNINGGKINTNNNIFINQGLINNPLLDSGCGVGTIIGSITSEQGGSIGTACPPP